MHNRKILVLALAALLVGSLIYLSRDWFEPADIQIGSSTRQNPLSDAQQRRFGPAVRSMPYTVSFTFNRSCKLDSLKVVRVSELETNRFAHPLWSLVSRTNAVPVKAVTYGVPLRGMRTEVKGDQAEPLEPGVSYRLIIKVGKREATHDFFVGRKPI